MSYILRVDDTTIDCAPHDEVALTMESMDGGRDKTYSLLAKDLFALMHLRQDLEVVLRTLPSLQDIIHGKEGAGHDAHNP